MNLLMDPKSQNQKPAIKSSPKPAPNKERILAAARMIEERRRMERAKAEKEAE